MSPIGSQDVQELVSLLRGSASAIEKSGRAWRGEKDDVSAFKTRTSRGPCQWGGEKDACLCELSGPQGAVYCGEREEEILVKKPLWRERQEASLLGTMLLQGFIV